MSSRKNLLLFCRFGTSFVKPFHDWLIFVMHSEGRFSSGKFLSQKSPNWSDKWLVFVICIERAFERLLSAPEGGNGQAAFAEKALSLAKMSNNALFLSRLVKGGFLRENFLQEMLKSGLTIGPFLSYLLEGL